jgi:hypothetical protein
MWQSVGRFQRQLIATDLPGHCCLPVRYSVVHACVQLHPGLPHLHSSPQLQFSPQLHTALEELNIHSSCTHRYHADRYKQCGQLVGWCASSHDFGLPSQCRPYPQLALPHGFLEVHSCGLHLHWPGGHLQLSQQAGQPILKPASPEHLALRQFKVITPQKVASCLQRWEAGDPAIMSAIVSNTSTTKANIDRRHTETQTSSGTPQ